MSPTIDDLRNKRNHRPSMVPRHDEKKSPKFPLLTCTMLLPCLPFPKSEKIATHSIPSSSSLVVLAYMETECVLPSMSTTRQLDGPRQNVLASPVLRILIANLLFMNSNLCKNLRNTQFRMLLHRQRPSLLPNETTSNLGTADGKYNQTRHERK